MLKVKQNVRVVADKINRKETDGNGMSDIQIYMCNNDCDLRK